MDSTILQPPGDYPDDWLRTDFDHFATLQRGKDLTRDHFRNGEIPVAGSNGIIGYHDVANVKAPGITVGRSGSVGKVTFYRQDFWAHNTALFVKDFHGNAPEFTAFFLNFLRLGRFGSGASVPTLDRNVFRTLPIVVPSPCEQRKIAAVLGLVQQAIEQQERLIALTTELKKALLHKLFTEGLRGESQKQTELGPMPESWELLPLERVISQKIVDGVHKTPTYIDSGIPFITAKDIIENRISFGECRYISAEEHKQLTRRVRPRRGDVFLTKVGTVGNVGIVDFDDEFSFFVQLALIRPNAERLVSDYLYWSLQYGAVQSEISSNAPQSTMKFIGTQKIAKIRIPVPPLAEQREIACSVSVVHSRIDIARRKLEAMRGLFRTLQHHLMTARIRVNGFDFSEREGEI